MSLLMPMGGNLNAKNPRVLREFVRLAGGNAAQIAILPQASALEDTGAYYQHVFMDLGAAQARVVEAHSRPEAASGENLAALRDCTGIFIAGGNQMRLTTLLGGTRLEAELHNAAQRGVIVGGTSAGAAVMPRVMVAYGKSGPTPRANSAQFVPGFGLSGQFAIDQHFRQRDRLGRLLYIIAAHPGLVGLGIDEDTAAIIEHDARVTVCGSGAVTVVDGSGIRATDAAELEGGLPVAVSDIRLHVLTAGCSFDAATREAHIAAKVLLSE